jgi:antitoxin component of MazEF toxin-antitoxin module
MRLKLRRIGTSVGVIIPKATLDAWRVAEGDALELRANRIEPPAPGSAKSRLNELRFQSALAVVRDFTPRQIKAKSLANLHRWKSNGTWVKAYDEWRAIVEDPDDGRLFAAMLGRDEDAIRLRQSAPYVGLLSREEVRRMNDEFAP